VSVWPQLLNIVSKRRPDIIECHDYKASYYGKRISVRYGTPMIATLHGWSGHKLREKYLYYPLHKLTVRNSQAVVAVSNDIAATIIRWGACPDKVHVIPNGIDIDGFRRCDAARHRIRQELGIPSDHVVVGAIGRLAKEKRFDVLIDAIAQLRQQGRAIVLVIAGSGELDNALSAHIRRHDLTGCCKLLGYRRDVAQLYSAFDVYAQSSDNEGTPGVLVEAMSCEVPIVATEVGGTGDLIEHGKCGLLVPRRSPSLLSQAIERVICDPSLASALAGRARRRVETHFSLAGRTAQLEQLYRTLFNCSAA
jgi:glycosyltransferase involved in cell wall biosynthesis